MPPLLEHAGVEANGPDERNKKWRLAASQRMEGSYRPHRSSRKKPDVAQWHPSASDLIPWDLEGKFIVNRSIVALLIIGCIGGVLSCSNEEPGFGGVRGTVTVDSQPAPPGTRVKFRHVEDQSSFLAIVGENGNYSYQPPKQAPLKTGDYQVGVEPVSSTTTVDETGLSVETPTSGAAESYGKYSVPAESGLEVTLTEGQVDFDIDIPSS